MQLPAQEHSGAGGVSTETAPSQTLPRRSELCEESSHQGQCGELDLLTHDHCAGLKGAQRPSLLCNFVVLKFTKLLCMLN